jgi:uncharacterized protein YciI
MTQLFVSLIVLLLGFGNSHPSPAPEPAGTTATAPQDTLSPAAFVASLEVYKVGIIRKGGNWTADSPAKIKELAKKNGEVWRAAIIDGSLVGVAEVVDPGEIVAALFFKKQTEEGIKKIAANAPAVKSGLVRAEVQEVWGTKGLGVGLSDKAAAGVKAPAKIKYLAGLEKDGKMKYFGVFTDMALKIRGFGIFKTASDKEALELMTQSPAVKSGALDAGVKTVEVAEGTLK